MGGVYIGMIGITTYTGEGMLIAGTKLTTATAPLGGEGWIDVVHCQAKALSLVYHCLRHHAIEPLGKIASGACALFPVLPDLLDTQVLEDQYCIAGRPFAELRSGLPAERPSSVSMSATQPFQKPTHAVRMI